MGPGSPLGTMEMVWNWVGGWLHDPVNVLVHFKTVNSAFNVNFTSVEEEHKAVLTAPAHSHSGLIGCVWSAWGSARV